MRAVILALTLALAGAAAGDPPSCGGLVLFRLPAVTSSLKAPVVAHPAEGFVAVLTSRFGALQLGIYATSDTTFKTNLLPANQPGSREPGRSHPPINLSAIYFNDRPNPWLLPVTGTEARVCIHFSNVELKGGGGAKTGFGAGELLISWHKGGA